jgi:hypothetical protein
MSSRSRTNIPVPHQDHNHKDKSLSHKEKEQALEDQEDPEELVEAAEAQEVAALKQQQQPLPFSCTLALLSNQALDYSIPANAKLYFKAIMPLETKFDLTQANMKDFLEALRAG